MGQREDAIPRAFTSTSARNPTWIWASDGKWKVFIFREIAVGEQRHVNITVVSAPPTPTDYFAVDTVILPYATGAIGPEHMWMPLAEALELRLSEKIAELTHQSEHEPLAEDV